MTTPAAIPTSVHELHGVGPVLAERILHRFGGKASDGSPLNNHAAALALIQNSPHQLTTIRGIGPATATQIILDNFPNTIPPARPSPSAAQPPASPEAESTKQLEQLPGVGPSIARSIVRELGMAPDGSHSEETALREILADPYSLLRVPGIGFATARRIAIDVYKVPADDPRHALHGNQAILDTYGGVVPLSKYHSERARYRLDATRAKQGITIQHGHAWSDAELEAETFLAGWLAEALKAPHHKATVDAHPANTERHRLNAEQAMVVTEALANPVFLLTGGAGTGKTITVAALVDAAWRQGFNTHVMTFAGKSAERVARACRNANIRFTETPAYGTISDEDLRHERTAGMVHVTTIHRGLRATGRNNFQVLRLHADLIILDEASMVPNALFAELLYRVKPNTRVVLVGDPAQLPPITYGQPFRDLLTLPLPKRHLEQNYRQANQETIHSFATAIRNHNRRAPFWNAPGVNTHFVTDVDERLSELVADIKHNNENLFSWQVITSTNKTRLRLNALLQAQLNSQGRPVITISESRQSVVLRVGDKIVTTRNNYEHDIMNGQTGIITEFTEGSVVLLMDDDRPKTIPLDALSTHATLGYAITVHKAQGSSWRTVISVEEQRIWSNSNSLHYTAVTRAEHQLHCISSLTKQAWWEGATRAERTRQSTLLQRLPQKSTP